MITHRVKYESAIEMAEDINNKTKLVQLALMELLSIEDGDYSPVDNAVLDGLDSVCDLSKALIKQLKKQIENISLPDGVVDVEFIDTSKSIKKELEKDHVCS